MSPYYTANLCAILLSGAHYFQTRKSKNSTRKRNFKRKRTRSLCVGTSDLSNDTKNIPQNLVRLSLKGVGLFFLQIFFC
jgi:hypothetical protein